MIRNSRKHVGWISTVAVALVVSACGRNEVMNTQEGQRSDVAPELQGTWSTDTTCEAKTIRVLKIEGEVLTVERKDFQDTECTDPLRTTTQKGKFQLAHTYKTGIPNSIIWHSADEVTVQIQSETDLDVQNLALTKLRNTNETEIDIAKPVTDKKITARANLLLREVKKLEPWSLKTPTTLNRFQYEQLVAKGLGTTSVTALNTRTSLKYEVDNSYLQFSTGGADFVRVFKKQ